MHRFASAHPAAAPDVLSERALIPAVAREHRDVALVAWTRIRGLVIGHRLAHLHLDDMCAGRHVDDARSSAFILRVADLYPVDVDERARGDAGNYDLGPVRHGLGSMKPAAARKQSQHDEKRFFQSTHPAVGWIRA